MPGNGHGIKFSKYGLIAGMGYGNFFYATGLAFAGGNGYIDVNNPAMKRTLLLLTGLLFATLPIFAQQAIVPEQATQFVGQQVTVCGKIYGGKHLKSAKNQPTFLNMGAAYPKQQLTLVIWSNIRKTFAAAPEVAYNGKTVCVTGKIDTYKNQPQIVIYAASQITEKK